MNDPRSPAHGDQRSQRIWETVARIPCGQVATYGQIADVAGHPRGARLVGHALRHCPDDLELPWHRVINAQGAISFPHDSDAYRRQKGLLEAEGVVFLNGRVNLKRYRWQESLDAMLWDPEGWV